MVITIKNLTPGQLSRNVFFYNGKTLNQIKNSLNPEICKKRASG